MRLILLGALYCAQSYSMTSTEVIKICAKTGYKDCSLVSAIARVESEFNPNVINRRGKRASYGLAQLEYRTAKELGFKGEIADLLNPRTNIKLCIKYLLKLEKKYSSMEKVVAAYNAGKVKECYTPQKCYIKKYRNYKYIDKVLNFRRITDERRQLHPDSLYRRRTWKN